MMELWADLYQEDPDSRYLELMRHCERPRMTEGRLKWDGCPHQYAANATIPEGRQLERAGLRQAASMPD